MTFLLFILIKIKEMLYFEFLPEEIFIPIVSKLPLDDITNLTKVVTLNDNFFRFLYSIKFSFIFNIIKDFFPLDPNITWINHYFQVIKINGLFEYYELLLLDRTNIHERIVKDTLDAMMSNLNHKYILTSSKYAKKYILSKRYQLLRVVCHIPHDYYIIRSLYYISKNKTGRMKMMKYLMYPFFEYSKTYVDNILYKMIKPIYIISTTRHGGYIMLLAHKVSCETLDVYYKSVLIGDDINFIKSNNETIVYDKYKIDGLWIKYLFTYFPQTIKLK